jgi:translation initiation factor 2B subunit (eIF-2B alpha/beta/delta family)
MGTYKVEQSVLDFQKDELYNCLIKNFSDFSIMEVHRAFEVGIYGESGPFFGLCLKTYQQFLKHYKTRPERFQALNEYLKLTETKQELTEMEKQKIIIDGMNEALEEYKKTRQHSEGHWVYYRYLKDKLGVIVPEPERQVEIKKLAENDYANYVNEAIARFKAKGGIKDAQDCKVLLTQCRFSRSFRTTG